MRETEPDSLRHSPETLDPPRRTRAAWWFGIYFVAQIPLISLIAGFYLFPIGLFRPLFPPDGGDNAPSAFLVIVGPYVVYLMHLIASLNVRSRNIFQLLMVVLIVLVVLNLVGCESMVEGLHNIH